MAPIVAAPPPSPATAASVPLDFTFMAHTMRDDTYYLQDGNTVIQVSRTLFKVHRSRLTQDQSVFGDMFSLDEDSIYDDDGISEGSSDERPIYLEGDTVEEFKDLLWCLYALPHEIEGSMSTRTSVLRLTNVVRMAHKYHFVNIEQWALRSLTTLYSGSPAHSTPLAGHRYSRPLPQVPGPSRSPSISSRISNHDISSDPALVGPDSVTTHALVQTTEVAVLTRYRPLLSIMRTKWKARIGERRDLSVAVNLFSRILPHFVPPSPPTSSSRFSTSRRTSLSHSYPHVVAESDRCDLDDLQGLAYYGLMLQGRQAWNRDPLLTREHRIRLLSGHHELTRLCDALPTHPPVFPHVTEEEEDGRLTPTQGDSRTRVQACFNASKCRDAWNQLWYNITRSDSDFSSLALVLYQASNAASLFSPPTVSGSTPGNERADYMWKVMLAISIIQALVERSIPRENLMPDELNEACAARGLETARRDLDDFRKQIMTFFEDVD